MAMTVKLEGSQDFAKALMAMSAEVQAKVEEVVTGTAVELRGDVVKSISRGPATGRVYRKYNPSRVHRASAPGQAPMTDTGRLVNSITFDQIGPLTAVVGSNIVYALYLEYGTARMSPRPFFRPAVERMRDKFLDRLSRAVGEAIT